MASKNHENLGRLMLLMAQGLKTALPAGTKTLHFNGKAHPVGDLVSEFNAYGAYWTAAEEAQSVAHGKVVERDAVAPTAKTLHDAAKLAVRSLLGTKNPELKKFGIEPEKDRKKLSGEERAAASAKARATRSGKKGAKPGA